MARGGANALRVQTRLFSASARAAQPVNAALLTVRAPVLLRTPTALETEYYRFNLSLADALQQPFPKDQYFKKGSAAESRFDAYYSALRKSWDVSEATKSDEGAAGADNAALYATQPRTTAADEKGDTSSLERALDRTLYLFVKQDGAWRLPTKPLPETLGPTDSLHASALAAGESVLGNRVDLWLVSRLPVAVIKSASPKTYIIRARVLAGVPSAGAELAWLTKEEAAKHVDPEYWAHLEPLLDE
ncbi:hypothetical protein MCUN1_000149 [Malassezia cuniculi]|uniref:Large ribosomal subunit protein mL46 n=1 Tax=Malassezia cuniculi TaxID=948313 RepID=A0AAF0EN14_9BASI|nr:hypothetical protein MCUN1_000149 [Malassezia cuniculi]